MIKAILACDEEGGIAKEGTLPWPNNPRDLKWYKDHTTNNVIVMGSTTWVDPHMPCPMPNRTNVVVTTQDPSLFDAADVISDNLNESLLELEKKYSDQIIWVIGGAKIIEQALGVIQEFYISRIPGKHDCDTFLPLKKIETLFTKDWEESHPEVTFQIWKKI